MNVLLVGSGGREHTLAWTLSRSDAVERIYVAPGNGGTATTPRCTNVPIGDTDLAGLRAFAREKEVDLTVVGPEAPLVAGIVDYFAEEGLAVFGPGQNAARLEGSKAHAKQFMQRHGIPTGAAHIFSDYERAAAHVESLQEPPVIKASGLAAGKGVIVPDSMEAAFTALKQILIEKRFGPAGAEVLVEERLEGPELSVLAFADGETLRLMPPAQDHKRLLDGDRGPNTGGMGAFAPSPLATPELLDEVVEEILVPTLAGSAAEGAPYTGVLYAGLMLTPDGPRVLEFNCRLGDPEAQVILPLLESDLPSLLLACIEGRLSAVEPTWSDAAAVTVVMASAGYPGAYETGKPITGISAAEEMGCAVFHAGTAQTESGEVVSAGGRVLAVTATAPHMEQAVERAYGAVERIHFPGATYRRDIGR